MHLGPLYLAFLTGCSAVAANAASLLQNPTEQKTWTASNNKKMSVEELKALCGFKMSNSENSTRDYGMLPLPRIRAMGCRDTSCLPKEFTWLDEKEKCPSLSHIRKQKCGDCWAVSSAAVLSDRYCLWANEQRYFSAKEITACASGHGCNGGDPKEAMDYFVKEGVVTGGDIYCGQAKGCQPYPTKKEPQIKCDGFCEENYNVEFNSDKRKGVSAYTIITRNVNEIKYDLMNYGPLVATLRIYEDFRAYSAGIYKHNAGILLGHHAVRMVGWGEQSGIAYWIIANSYGEDWGENGFFRIVLGDNECGIESYLIGADTRPGSDKIMVQPSIRQINISATDGVTTQPFSAKLITPYIPIPKLCAITAKTSISSAFIGSNSGTVTGNSNIICRNSGTVDGSGNIICKNSGNIIGSTNIVCDTSALPMPSIKLDQCKKNGFKACESCSKDPDLRC